MRAWGRGGGDHRWLLPEDPKAAVLAWHPSPFSGDGPPVCLWRAVSSCSPCGLSRQPLPDDMKKSYNWASGDPGADGTANRKGTGLFQPESSSCPDLCRVMFPEQCSHCWVAGMGNCKEGIPMSALWPLDFDRAVINAAKSGQYNPTIHLQTLCWEPGALT